MKKKKELLNGAIVFGFIVINFWQFVAVPILPAVYGWTLLPLLFLNNSMWSAMHEAIHRNLFANRELNLWSGRLLSILFGSSFQFLSASHLTHHAVNRTEVERLEVIMPGQGRVSAAIKYYFFLCGGLYLAEVLVPLAFISPLVSLRKKLPHTSFARLVLERASRKHFTVFAESVCAIFFMVLSLYLYGDRWYLFVLIVGTRAFFISSLDYIYHYGNALDDVNASYNLKLPGVLSTLLLNFNLHHVHHLSPKTPWCELPAESNKRGERYDKGYFEAAAQAWKGPVVFK